ncbi:MAG: pantetheine-phosphate adenylyltransferase [Chloroflexi bacterium]|nr:pantetheine-phosphate adenylyltransferase [Chloroflexota bacterium]
MVTVAVYPGSFDPVTNGHVDIAARAASLFDELVVGVYDAPPRRLLFTTEERYDMMCRALAHLRNVRVEKYYGLTVDFARQVDARVVVRGLRAGADFDYEFEMALMNKKLAPELEAVYLMTSLDHLYISASRVREIAELGADTSNLVPPHVTVALNRKFRKGE